VTVVRPLDELDLADELRLEPDDVALAHLRHLRNDLERRLLALERPQLGEQPVDLVVGEPGPAVAHVGELAPTADGEHERAEPARAAALALRVAGDDELLLAVSLDLQPVACPFPLRVA
jgi:hypothetical protein